MVFLRLKIWVKMGESISSFCQKQCKSFKRQLPSHPTLKQFGGTLLSAHLILIIHSITLGIQSFLGIIILSFHASSDLQTVYKKKRKNERMRGVVYIT